MPQRPLPPPRQIHLQWPRLPAMVHRSPGRKPWRARLLTRSVLLCQDERCRLLPIMGASRKGNFNGCQEPAATRSASVSAAAGAVSLRQGQSEHTQQQWPLAASSASQTSGTEHMGLQKSKLIQCSPAGTRLLCGAATVRHTQRCPTIACLCGALESSDSEAA